MILTIIYNIYSFLNTCKTSDNAINPIVIQLKVVCMFSRVQFGAGYAGVWTDPGTGSELRELRPAPETAADRGRSGGEGGGGTSHSGGLGYYPAQPVRSREQ